MQAITKTKDPALETPYALHATDYSLHFRPLLLHPLDLKDKDKD